MSPKPATMLFSPKNSFGRVPQAVLLECSKTKH